jgi:hypothetical protein
MCKFGESILQKDFEVKNSAQSVWGLAHISCIVILLSFFLQVHDHHLWVACGFDRLIVIDVK